MNSGSNNNQGTISANTNTPTNSNKNNTVNDNNNNAENNSYATTSGRGITREECSTSSSVSMTRLHFVVSSVAALREVARRRHNPFNDFLARSVMIIRSGASSYVGEPMGMEGCSKKTLDFFVS